jgi:glucose-6-phosphate isomerase
VEYARIKAAAAKIQQDSRALVVIGIGGSYLGARGVIECLCSPNYNLKKKATPNVYFVGNNLSSDHLSEIMELVGDDDFSVNIISKSGTTTEPAVAFRFFRRKLEEKYGRAGAAKRIYATTDKAKGALKTMADAEGYETFVVPDDIGGRYSVLTAVGLLPIAVTGISIDDLMAGAAEMMDTCRSEVLDENPAWQYAACRYELYRNGKKIELLAAYEPSFRFMAEWWKQLYGESEGKENKGLFPASVEYTADLHSMGQYIQEGERHLMETVVRFSSSLTRNEVSADEADGDGLNFLAGRDMDYINTQAMDGVLLAHVEGGVPNICLNIGQRTAHTLGELIYFFEYACGLSGYLLDVNPFNQPGVEAYKKNMFALLGKPGYEEKRQALLEKLGR